ncbi:MAG: hypothetical protein K2Z80_13280 [Xanthobacteraceae bacterium]|nr:hypothetical protein [Xanthobacteraceae bacterium]
MHASIANATRHRNGCESSFLKFGRKDLIVAIGAPRHAERASTRRSYKIRHGKVYAVKRAAPHDCTSCAMTPVAAVTFSQRITIDSLQTRAATAFAALPALCSISR